MIRYLHSINQSMHELMAIDKNVVLIGEDLLDPYGGAFKASKGLSTQYPEQVISTPISELAITGASVGMAMRGIKPILEIMFGDFLTLCMDQIINHATKYQWMYNDQVSVPLVVRAPMGGGRGYGPTHSQSLESLFVAVPGLRIVAPSIFHDPGKLLKRCVLHETAPVLFVEDKISYPKILQLGNNYRDLKIQWLDDTDGYPNVSLSMFPEESQDILIITYGGMANLAAEAAIDSLMEEEINVQVLVCSQIRPIPVDVICSQASKIGKVIILEEGPKVGGWGAEAACIIMEKSFESLKSPLIRIGAMDNPIPASLPLEELVLPSLSKVKNAILRLYNS